MDSPAPSEGGSHLSKEQLLDYVKKQKAKIKALEAAAKAGVPVDQTNLVDELRAQDAIKIQELTSSLNLLQSQLATKEEAVAGKESTRIHRKDSHISLPL